MPRLAARAARRQAQALRGARHSALQRQRVDRRSRNRALVRCVARRAGSSPRPGAPIGSSSELFGALNRLGKTIDDCPSARRRRRNCWRWSPTARFRAASPSRCSRSCSKPARARRRSSRSAGSSRLRDTGAIDAAVDKVLAANADKVEQYKGGKQALFGFFVGQTMKAMAGQGQPASGQRAAAGEARLTSSDLTGNACLAGCGSSG